MKRHSSFSTRQLLFTIAFLLTFSGMTLFLFSYQRDEKRFTSITTELFTNEMKSDTLNMHYNLAVPEDFGICSYEPLLAGYDAERSLHTQAQIENTLAALYTLHTEKLSETDAYLWKLLTRSLENSLALGNYSYYSEPLSPSSGAQAQLPILLAEYTFRRRQDVEDYLMLLEQTDAYFASLLTYEQEKAAAGLSMPGTFLKEVRAQCDTIITKESLETGTHFLQTTFQERLQPLLEDRIITSQEAQDYIFHNDRLLKTVLLPAYTALGDGILLLEDDSILPTGLASLPEGKSYYEQLLIAETGSYRSIDEIMKLLTEQFSMEYDCIREILAAHPDILQSYNDDLLTAFPYQDAPQMLLDLQKRMGDDFPALPEGATQVSVKAVSANLEAYCAPAFYLTAPLDDTDSNTIYINRQKTPAGLDLYTTLAHEGYPGHLYQNVYYSRTAYTSHERPVRELLWYGGYLEGWALYVELLSNDYAAALLREHGQENAAVIAQLEGHNRSLQICLYSMLDIMIHYQGAAYDQIAKILQNFGITDSLSHLSIYNYIVQEPCNYLKYYLGYLEILSLQENARILWGNAYTDYRFHCFYLDCGPSDFLSLQERLAAASNAE